MLNLEHFPEILLIIIILLILNDHIDILFISLQVTYLPGTFTFGTLCSSHNSSSRVQLFGFVWSLQGGRHAARRRVWNNIYQIKKKILRLKSRQIYLNLRAT